MKPMRNWVLLCNGVEIGYVEFDEVVSEGNAREASNRVAKFLMLTRSGKSLED